MIKRGMISTSLGSDVEIRPKPHVNATHERPNTLNS